MSVARTARRRRKQYAGGFHSLTALFGGPLKTPRYKKRSQETLAMKEARFREKQKTMMGRKKK